MKTIILARVSTEEQLDGFSIPAQLERARKYAKHKGLIIDQEYQFDESSMLDQRKKFDQIILYIKKSKEKVTLIVETVDRLQRDFRATVLLEEFIKLDKIELHFIRENLVIHQDSNSSEKTRWNLGVLVANSYILQLADNVKRSVEKKIKNGEWTSKAPIGYLNVAIGGKNTIIPDTDKAPYIAKIFELYAQRKYSMKMLAEEMKAAGLRTKSGKVLSSSQVERIIKNPFYYGVMQVKGQQHPHIYKPLITKDLFIRCQEVRTDWNKKPFQYAAKPFALRGLIKCDKCGCTVTPECQGKYVYYSCTNYKGICKRIYVREEDLLKPIEEKLMTLHISEETATEIIEEFKKNNEAEMSFHKQALASLQTEYAKGQNRIDELMDLLLDKVITKDDYDRKLQQLKASQEQRSKLIAEHESYNEDSYVTVQKVFDLANNAYDLYKNSEPNEKRQLIEFLVQNCRLRERNLMFTIREPFDNLFSYSHLKLWLTSRVQEPSSGESLGLSKSCWKALGSNFPEYKMRQMRQ